MITTNDYHIWLLVCDSFNNKNGNLNLFQSIISFQNLINELKNDNKYVKFN